MTSKGEYTVLLNILVNSILVVSESIKGVLVRDPDSAWDAKPFYKFIRDVYNKYIIPGRVDVMEDKVRSDVKDFKEQIKAFLELSGKR